MGVVEGIVAKAAWMRTHRVDERRVGISKLLPALVPTSRDEARLLSLATTYVTKMAENNPGDEDDDEIGTLLAATALLTTETAAIADTENDEEDELRAVARTMLTTNTAATTDQETDPDDDFQLLAYHAMLTTLTESSGDNESDPEDGAMRLEDAVGGRTFPLAYRYAVEEPAQSSALRYDDALQLHVLKNGLPVVEALRHVLSMRV
jgi:hypothetical protein